MILFIGTMKYLKSWYIQTLILIQYKILKKISLEIQKHISKKNYYII